jgi:hypothetical protein
MALEIHTNENVAFGVVKTMTLTGGKGVGYDVPSIDIDVWHDGGLTIQIGDSDSPSRFIDSETLALLFREWLVK